MLSYDDIYKKCVNGEKKVAPPLTIHLQGSGAIPLYDKGMVVSGRGSLKGLVCLLLFLSCSLRVLLLCFFASAFLP